MMGRSRAQSSLVGSRGRRDATRVSTIPRFTPRAIEIARASDGVRRRRGDDAATTVLVFEVPPCYISCSARATDADGRGET